MKSLHYAAMKFADRWKLVGNGLRWGDFATLDEALTAAERMAKAVGDLGVEVHLHAHDDSGVLRRTELR